MQVNDIVTFSPRFGESAEGIVTRVWDKPVSDPYVTIRTIEDEGRTFVRCSSVVVQMEHGSPEPSACQGPGICPLCGGAYADSEICRTGA